MMSKSNRLDYLEVLVYLVIFGMCTLGSVGGCEDEGVFAIRTDAGKTCLQIDPLTCNTTLAGSLEARDIPAITNLTQNLVVAVARIVDLEDALAETEAILNYTQALFEVATHPWISCIQRDNGSPCLVPVGFRDVPQPIAGYGYASTNIDGFNTPGNLVYWDLGARVVTVDSGNARVTSVDLTQWPPNAHEVWGGTGVPGMTNTTLLDPGALAVGGFGPVIRVAVADPGSHRVLEFSDNTGWTEAGVRGAPGTPGSSPETLNTPRGVAYDVNRAILYVADTNNSRILAFCTPNCTDGSEVIGPGAGLGRPGPLEVNPSTGDLYVLDLEARRVFKFLKSEGFSTRYPRSAPPDSGEEYVDLGVNHDLEDVFLVDSGNSRIVVAERWNNWTTNYVVIRGPETIVNSDPLFQPRGVAVIPLTGDILVSDGHHRVIRVFRERGVNGRCKGGMCR